MYFKALSSTIKYKINSKYLQGRVFDLIIVLNESCCVKSHYNKVKIIKKCK